MSSKINKPFHFFYLKVDSKNHIFVRQYGNKYGVPIILLHGGPGEAYSNHKISKIVDLKKTHLILIDQRGCGKSKPKFTIHNTNNLLSDIKKVKEHLKITKFIITGGSWGAILSLLYTIQYPNDIINYVLVGGMYQFDNTIWPRSLLNMYPDKWKQFCNLVNIKGKNLQNPSLSLQKKICDLYFTKIKKKEAKYIKAWYEFENSVIFTVKENKNKKINYDTAFYESFYYSNNFFFEEDYIQKNLYKIKKIKGFILHGRLDLICNFNESYQLNKKLPNSKLLIQNYEGHSGIKLKQDWKEILFNLVKKNYSKKITFYL